jgi:hypothetical protein
MGLLFLRDLKDRLDLNAALKLRLVSYPGLSKFTVMIPSASSPEI